MELSAFFKSVLEQDYAPIVICDLNHTIIYMNGSAVKRYEKFGGEKLLGRSLLLCHNGKSGEMINKALEWFSKGIENNTVFESRNEKENKDVYIIALRDDKGKLIGYYEKHEYRTSETAKPYGNL